jgi:ribosomal-protein-alanine N-acetyltransferase
VIRPATPADRPALLDLQSRLPEPSPGLLDAALDDAASASAPATATALVSANEDGAPVGHLLAVPGDGTTYVAELVVAPDHRREGRARALLAACAERAGDDALTVTVAPDNGAARSLYRNCGFEKRERLPDFFEDGAAIRYRRD